MPGSLTYFCSVKEHILIMFFFFFSLQCISMQTSFIVLQELDEGDHDRKSLMFCCRSKKKKKKKCFALCTTDGTGKRARVARTANSPRWGVSGNLQEFNLLSEDFWGQGIVTQGKKITHSKVEIMTRKDVTICWKKANAKLVRNKLVTIHSELLFLQVLQRVKDTIE